MANNLTHATALRTDFANLATGTATTFAAGSGQVIKIYSGAMPANAAAGLSGNVVISTTSALTWGAGSAGVAALTNTPSDGNATGGTASFYRRFKSDGSTVIAQGACGTSGAELNLNSLTIAGSATVTITSGSYTSTV